MSLSSLQWSSYSEVLDTVDLERGNKKVYQNILDTGYLLCPSLKVGIKQSSTEYYLRKYETLYDIDCNQYIVTFTL